HVERVGGDTRAEARGKNINIPWPTLGMGDLEYLQVFLDIVAPVVREYEPHIVFLSCGFDSAAGDLLGSMCVSPSGYYLLTKAVSALCPHLVVALEGGYNLSNVARCSEAVMRALLESSGTAPLPRSRMLWCQTEELVKRVRQRHEGYWRCFSHPE
ncbi:histone deacetylase, partial [Trypanosoma cruzi]